MESRQKGGAHPRRFRVATATGKAQVGSSFETPANGGLLRMRRDFSGGSPTCPVNLAAELVRGDDATGDAPQNDPARGRDPRGFIFRQPEEHGLAVAA